MSQKKAWLITAGVACASYCAIRVGLLLLPPIELLYPPHLFPPRWGTSIWWLHAFLLIPFLVVVGLTLLVAGLSKLAKATVFLGTWAIYAPLLMLIIAPMAAALFPSFAVMVVLRWAFYPWVGAGYLPLYGSPARDVVMPPLIAIGFAIAIVGLVQVAKAARGKYLVTDGLYATVRHPQYLGIAIWALGFALWGSSYIDCVVWFTMVFTFALLALREEKRLGKQFGADYLAYRQEVPFMLPLWRLKGMPLPAAGWLRLIALAGIYVVGVVVIVAIFALLGW